MRIASFLPSATEMLFALGAADDVCAVTFECDYPAEARAKPHVVHSHMPPGLTPAEIDAIVSAEGAQGRSLYFADIALLESLEPDLILLQDLCRVCAIDSPTLARDMAHLASQPRVLSLSAHSLEDVFRDIETVGAAIGRRAAAATLTTALRTRVETIRAASMLVQTSSSVAPPPLSEAPPPLSGAPSSAQTSASEVAAKVGFAGTPPAQPPSEGPGFNRAVTASKEEGASAPEVSSPRVLCLEWLDPLFQGGHWVPEMITLAGGTPVLATPREKSVRITWQQVRAADPEIIVVMPCGYHLADTITQYEHEFLARFRTNPESEAAQTWQHLSAVRNNRVFAVDGSSYFSRPGPRLVDGLEILAAILHSGPFAHLPHASVAQLAPN